MPGKAVIYHVLAGLNGRLLLACCINREEDNCRKVFFVYAVLSTMLRGGWVGG